jgi:hypothetical protein
MISTPFHNSSDGACKEWLKSAPFMVEMMASSESTRPLDVVLSDYSYMGQNGVRVRMGSGLELSVSFTGFENLNYSRVMNSQVSANLTAQTIKNPAFT